MRIINISEEISIAREPPAVWAILTEVSSWRLWSHVIDRAVIYGQVKPGTSFKCQAGKWDFDGTIIEALPGELFKCRGKTVGLDIVMSWGIAVEGSTTSVAAIAGIRGWMASLFPRRVKSSLESALFTWLLALKNYSEHGATVLQDKGKLKSVGRLKKKKISLSDPLGLLLPGRRRRHEEDE
jgi:hypothetical protein